MGSVQKADVSSLTFGDEGKVKAEKEREGRKGEEDGGPSGDRVSSEG